MQLNKKGVLFLKVMALGFFLAVNIHLIFYSTGEEPFLSFRPKDAWLMLILTSYCSCLWMIITTSLVRKLIRKRERWIKFFFIIGLIIFCIFMIYTLFIIQCYYISDLVKWT